MDVCLINQEFLHHAEELLMRSKPCLVVFRVENEGLSSVKGIITHFQTHPSEESYLRMDNGLFISLERVVSVDGLPLSNLV